MNNERPQKPMSRLESLKDTLRRSPETFGDLEVSMLFLDADYLDFKDAMKQLGKLGRTFTLIFVMDDMGETIDDKKRGLRRLKAMREDRYLKNIITKIIVKGRPGEQSVEPNVFSSDVRFVELD
ncbi:MAG: hypothetical protein KC662_03015 [Candidatus Magasanikbacteria bacterium]|nr:hypothetical protein [Candidatus Magasanikbacteria bacterium]